MKTIAGLLLFVSPLLLADTVFLKDGRSVDGEVLSQEEDVVVVKTSSGREVISMKNVKEIKRTAVPAAAPQKSAAAIPADALKHVEKAERATHAGAMEDAVEAYEKAVKVADHIEIHRRLGHAFFNKAEQITIEYRPQLEASLADWEVKRTGAIEERKSMVAGKFKKLNENDKDYVTATEKHKELLKKVNQAFPFYDQALNAFTAVLRHSRYGKDFDAAAHQILCLTIKGDMVPRTRGRNLLVAFLKEYNPNTAGERAMYARLEAELERLDKFMK